MDINKEAVRVALIQAITYGVKRHFRSAHVDLAATSTRASILHVKVLGLTFDIRIKLKGGNNEND